MPDRPRSPWLPTESAPPDAEGTDAPPGNPWNPPVPAGPTVGAVDPDAATPDHGPVTAPPAPASGGLRASAGRKHLVPVWLLAFGAVALVATAVVCVILAMRHDTGGPVPAAASGLDASAARLRTVRDPFVLDGVRWAVFASPSQSWTQFTQSAAPGPGKRWMLVAVRVRNLSRGSFVPDGLGYRLTDDAGTGYAADPEHSTTGAAGPAIPINGLDQVQLAFRVPAGATGLTLRYATRVSGGTAVGVPVGGS